jgi:hypothetical protein
MTSVNKKHSQLLDKYVKYIQGVVYEATEFSAVKKFEEFNEILHNIINYTNTFQKIVKNSDKMSEWVYMQPNLMLYTSMGFLSGIKNKKNKNLIDSLTEDLFEKTVDFIGETVNILDAVNEKKEVEKKIKLIQKERNEYNG